MVDQPIDDLVVNVKPNFRGFRAALISGIQASSRNVAARVSVKLDTGGVAAQLRTWARTQRATVNVGVKLTDSKVQVAADGVFLRRSVRNALAGYAVKVRVAADLDQADIRRQAAESTRRSSRARSNPLRNILDLGAPGVRPLTLLYAAAAAMSPVLVAMAASASYAALSFTSLAAGAIGLVGSITAVTIAFGSVIDYMTQYEAVQKAAVQQQAQSAEQELQRQSALRSGIVQLGSARRAHAEAIRGERAAEEQLHQAREQAKRDLEDLIELRSDLRRQETGASLDLEQAKADEAEARRSFFASDLEKRQAKQKLDEAEDALSDVKRERKRNAEDLKKIAAGGGIEGMESVKQARDTLRNATEQVVETRQRIRDAQLDLADAHKRAAMQADANTAAENELARQWADMSGPARNLATWLKRHEGLFKEYRRQMERAVLPGFIKFLDQITDRGKGGKGKSVLDVLADGAALLGKVVGDTVAKLGKAMNTPWFKELWKRISGENGKAFQNFGDTLVILLKPLARIIAASAPLLTMFSEWLEKNAQKFADWIDTISDKDMETFFVNAAKELKKWWDIAAEIFKIVLGVFKAALPSGGNLTERLGEFLKQIREWVESKEGQKKLREFFEMLEDVNWVYIAKGITIVGAALAGLRFGPWVAVIAGGATAIALFKDEIFKLHDEFVLFGFGIVFGIAKGISDGWKNLKETFNWVNLEMQLFGAGIIGGIVKGIGSGWASFTDTLKSVETRMYLFGFGLIFGVWDGIKAGWTTVKEKLTQFWNDFVGENKKIMKIKSPSQVMRDEVGAKLIEGIWAGVTETWTNMLPGVLTWISEQFGKPLKDAFGLAGTGARNMFVAPFDALTTRLTGPVMKMLTWIDTNVIGPLNKVLVAINASAKIPEINSKVGATVGGAGGKAITKIAEVVRRADGGRIPGYSPHSRADNIPAMLTADEFVQPVSAVKKYGVGMMEDIRTGRFPRFADGGLVGKLLSSLGGSNYINNLGAGAIKLMGGNSIKALAAALAPPPSGVGGSGGGALGGPLGAAGTIPEWVQAAKAGSSFGRNSGIGNWIYQVVKAAGLAKSNQGTFVVRKTATGNKSMHGYGRAVDLPPSMAIFNFLRKNYGSRLKELIYSPAGNSQVYNGRNHYYTGVTRRMHFNHVHASYAKGGQVAPINSAYYDTGGTLPPGATLAINKTGQPETVRTAGQEKALMERDRPMRLDRRDIVLLAHYIASASAKAIDLDGRRVAEAVRSYDYLPGGF